MNMCVCVCVCVCVFVHSGFVSLVRDPSLVWDPKWGSSPPNRAGVIAPAVVVPIVAVIAIVLAVVIFVRRRRRSAFTGVSMAGGRDDLRAPLTGTCVGHTIQSHMRIAGQRIGMRCLLPPDGHTGAYVMTCMGGWSDDCCVCMCVCALSQALATLALVCWVTALSALQTCACVTEWAALRHIHKHVTGPNDMRVCRHPYTSRTRTRHEQTSSVGFNRRQVRFESCVLISVLAQRPYVLAASSFTWVRIGLCVPCFAASCG